MCGGYGVEKCGCGVDVDVGVCVMKWWLNCLVIGGWWIRLGRVTRGKLLVVFVCGGD